jgi:large subunit ribosomal protein L13
MLMFRSLLYGGRNKLIRRMIMSTYMPKAADIERKWYILDAKGKPLGRVAAQAATILRGKHKPTFAPHADCGDHVIIINCTEAVLTGKKLEQKSYRWHTGWIGGLKEIKYSDLMKKNPQKAMTIAVNGMLPNNTLGRKALTRLRVYAGAEHEQQAQKPELYEI